ncbi:hemolysin III family protein [Halorhodospira halochloris]|uniref:PAQR family membrane homeostasis protein TrhA n=1 Tax=Halorhodospira halochloris TaxID=1052 RepID=UPI001EE7FB34|nr:hemolysin III family protein [Halorhodospira halochloris]MCG5531382.1 hemolysin III family protein [Halorhodospira halochloris]
MSISSRSYSPGEQFADRLLHWIAIGAAIIGALFLFVLALSRGDAALVGSVSLYGLALIALFLASALCNHRLDDNHSRRAQWYRRLDHAAIFFMIAATYTPFTVSALGPPEGWLLLAFVWGLALIGIGAKLFLPRPPGHIFSVVLSLLLGWSVVVVINPMMAALSTAGLILLLIGGILYSTGVLFYIWYRLPYHNVAWHGLVVAAAACHYAAVMAAVVLAPEPVAL